MADNTNPQAQPAQGPETDPRGQHDPRNQQGPQGPADQTNHQQGWPPPTQSGPPTHGRQGYQVQQEPIGQPPHHPGYGYGQQYRTSPDPRGQWQEGPPPFPYQQPGYVYGDYHQPAPPPPPYHQAPYAPPQPMPGYQNPYPVPYQPPGYAAPGQPVAYPGHYPPYGQAAPHIIVLTAGQPPQVIMADGAGAGTVYAERPESATEDPRALTRTDDETAAEAQGRDEEEAQRLDAAPAEAAEATGEAEAPSAQRAVKTGVSGDLEKVLNDALSGLAMRDLSLVDALLEMVEELETDAQDPDLLDKLFQIDNFATRMRRNGENLLVLTGHDGGESDAYDEIVPLLDVARAATSEIKDYPRVRIGKLPQSSITGMAADDISHLLAELLDNATANSPEHSQVVISAQEMHDGRLMVVVEDEGVGIPEDQIGELNKRLSGAAGLHEDVSRHMGLYVASRIARKHGLETRLEARSFRGVNAYAIIPKELLRVSTPPVPGQSRTSAIPSTGAPTPSNASGSAPAAPKRTASGNPAPPPGGKGDSSVTSAGLPRRSATPHGSPLRMMPRPDPSKPAPPPPGGGAPRLTGEARAEQIRDELGDFFDGEREALEESRGEEDKKP